MALTDLPLASSPLDPAAHRREDQDWLLERWQASRSRVAVFAGDGDRVQVEQAASGWRVAWQHPGTVAADPRDLAGWVFLGVDAADSAHFAAVAPDEPPTEQLLAVRQLGIADAVAADLTPVVAGLAVLNWHRRHPRCPLCGAATVIAAAGWQRRCPADDTLHFPRVDPAVIMLVIGADDRALLGRQARWPVGWFSTLAGFVEPGETLENAVRREVAEEVGVRVGDVQYQASQPWPFPSSLMLGFVARTADVAVVPDEGEIAEARWFSRSELARSCESGATRLPPRFSISRALIEQWYGTSLPGDWSRE